jgi:hypothetical protein
LKEVLTWLVPLTMVYGFASLVLLVARQIYEVTHQSVGFFTKTFTLFKVLSYGIMIAALFAISLVILNNFHLSLPLATFPSGSVLDHSSLWTFRAPGAHCLEANLR